jgi:hypothetical protein
MSQPDFSKLFTEWKSHRTPKTVPHTVCIHPTARIAAIIQRRGQRANGDWAIRADLLKSASAALGAGKYTSVYVVQAEEQKALRWETVATVVANIGDATPLDGYLGHPFHWLDENFKLVNRSGSWSDDEPF